MNKPSAKEVARPTIHPGRIILHTLFGVILPATALAMELVYGWSSEIYVDPIPTWINTLAIACVPLSIAASLARLATGRRIEPIDLHANSFCLAVSAVYAVIYAPITPFAAFGIIAYGMGLLPLAPLIALFCLYRIRKEMKRRLDHANPIEWKHLYAGFGLGVLTLSASVLPLVITEYGISRMTDSDSSNDASAMRLLRNFGSEKILLRACYQSRERVIIGDRFGTRSSIGEARKLFYRVTGEPFNQHRQERGFLTPRGRGIDRDLGGERIGQRVESVSLESSRQDGTLHPDLGFGYTEWTMVFKNDHAWNQQEARMYISMPMGGVASRVTLWVDGEPREAAFGSKAQVRQAYEKVAVRQRRDPILVNWAGPDLLLAQCFPIPPDGGTMKVRIGISFPLEQVNGQMGFRYPTITANNFVIPEDLRHSLWYEEQTPTGLKSHPPIDLSHDTLPNQYQIVQSTLPLNTAPFMSPHPTGRGEALILRAQIGPESTEHKAKVVVIDGSIAMKPYATTIARWLRQQDAEIDLYFAGDAVSHIKAKGSDCADWLSDQSFIGGRDSMPALVQATRQLQSNKQQNPRGIIHLFGGPQPIQLTSAEPLNQLLERRPTPIQIVACIVNREYNALYELAPINFAERRYLLPDGTLGDSTVHYQAIESNMELPEGPSHPHRLSIADTVCAKASDVYQTQSAASQKQFRQQLASLAKQAAEAYLVTQLSGAVVLETDAQYTENKLEAGDPNATPTVPETKQFALLLGIASLAWIALQRRHNQRAAT